MTASSQQCGLQNKFKTKFSCLNSSMWTLEIIVASAKRVPLPNSLLLANKERCAQDVCRIPLGTLRSSKTTWVWTKIIWFAPFPILWQWCLLYQFNPSATSTSFQQLIPQGLLWWDSGCVWRIEPLTFLRRCCARILALASWYISGRLCLTTVQWAWSRKWGRLPSTLPLLRCFWSSVYLSLIEGYQSLSHLSYPFCHW